jgi:hypothetical protein
MGLEPERVIHLSEGFIFLGNVFPALIDHAGEAVIAPNFSL